MNPLLLRSSMRRLSRPSSISSFLTSFSASSRPRPYATQSYGGEDMSGHPKSDAANPKVHVEHPGPESPASNKDTTSQSQSQSSDNSASTATATSTSQGGRPAISNPSAPSEDANEEVRRHNEDVARRSGRGGDGKVEKGFWTGKTGI